jgi:hypothetical protein
LIIVGGLVENFRYVPFGWGFSAYIPHFVTTIYRQREKVSAFAPAAF